MKNRLLTLDEYILGKDNVLYHGTSIDALAKILKYGFFYQYSHFAGVLSRLKRVLSYETNNEWSFSCLEPYNYSLQGAYNYSKQIACYRAFYDFLYNNCSLADALDELGDDYENWFDDYKLKISLRRELEKIAVKKGHEKKSVKKNIDKALKRKGVIVGIHRDFFVDKQIDDFRFEAVYVEYPPYRKKGKGIDVKFISSIYIVTPEEREEFVTKYKRRIDVSCSVENY
ncbi:hypothetical protein HY636_02115 [Candidatus Woesearchaeota archaeon]|nr:hypothetical protein [Candidatus Woesearchaeota archaeon]